MASDSNRYRLSEADYFAEVTPKDLIVLHFTAGTTVEGAIQTWKNDAQRVATAYVVDVDGQIYETFDPRFWAYHLGIRHRTTSTQKPGQHDRRSIGIELVNAGPLKVNRSDSGFLNWWPAGPFGQQYGRRFCHRDDASRYVAGNFRGFSYYAALPELQVCATLSLVRDLIREFRIPAIVPPPALRPACDLEYFGRFQGVASHQNFRPDKFDIGPAWDWVRLETELSALRAENGDTGFRTGELKSQ